MEKEKELKNKIMKPLYIAVIAENKQMFDECVKSLPAGDKYIFISNIQQAFGFEFDKIEVVGKFANISKFNRIFDYCTGRLKNNKLK